MDFEVLIIGTDINAYTMARSYFEAYNKKAYVIGKTPMFFTYCSNILNLTIIPDLWKEEKFLEVLNEFSNKHKQKIVLIGTNDAYVEMISKNKDKLKEKFLFNYPDYNIIKNLSFKDNFYETYKDSLDLPKTLIYKSGSKKVIKLDFDYPVVLKPANVIEYYKLKIKDKHKVYKIYNEQKLQQVVENIAQAGYRDNLIIQEYIPGDDTYLFDSMLYFSSKSEPVLKTFAQIGLQEQTKTGVGNCTVLINGYNQHNKNNLDKIVKFLKKINYMGFAEFDLKYDSRDGIYKVLEINARQSRSSYYVTACGHNMVKYLIDDLIYKKSFPETLIDTEYLLTFVPRFVMFKYIKNNAYKDKIKELIKAKKVVNPIKNRKDNSLKRKYYLFLRDINYIKKYMSNKW